MTFKWDLEKNVFLHKIKELDVGHQYYLLEDY